MSFDDYRFDGCDVHSDPATGTCLTRWDGGDELFSCSDGSEHQAETASALGYPNADAMNAEHDLLHHVVAHATGQGRSLVLDHVKGIRPAPEELRQFEESVVLLLARALNQGRAVVEDFRQPRT